MGRTSGMGEIGDGPMVETTDDDVRAIKDLIARQFASMSW